jgi:threonine dehydratase
MKGGTAAVKMRTIETISSGTLMISIDDIRAAGRRLAPHLSPTPLIHSPWLSIRASADVRLKLESLQVTRSFKVRGALNALTRLASMDPRPVVVTASAGNHGRGVAWAAERLGLHAVVFTPESAPQAKLAPIRSHGAELRSIAADYEDAERRAMEFSRTTGAAFVSAYSHEDVIAGAGTIALEIRDSWPEVDTIVVPIGGGGLVSGIARVARAASPAVRVVGVEAAQSCVFTSARTAGRIVPITVGQTLADGLSGNVDPDTLTWDYIRDLVDEVVTVSEDELAEGLRGLVAEDHLIAEGAGVAAVAAVAAQRAALDASRTAVVVSGANIDSSKLLEVLSIPQDPGR